MFQCNPQPNCTGWPTNCAEVQPDPDIAGIGVITSFVFTAAVTLVASIAGHLLRPSSGLVNLPPLDPRQYVSVLPPTNTDDLQPNQSEVAPLDRNKRQQARRELWTDILDRIILGLSDQQLATCFAILLTALIRSCQISIYHLNIIINLAWFSTITHLLSLIVLRHYWIQTSKRVALYVRAVLIICAMVMLVYILAILLQTLGASDACPVVCGFTEPSPPILFRGPIMVLRVTIPIVADIFIVFWAYPTTCLFVFPSWYKLYHLITWKLPTHCFKSLRRFCLSITSAQHIQRTIDRPIQIVIGVYRQILFPSQRLAIVAQVIVWCIRFVIVIIDRWEMPVPISDPEAENQWGFGQLLALIIVFLPLLTLLETWSEVTKSQENKREVDGHSGGNVSDSAILLQNQAHSTSLSIVRLTDSCPEPPSLRSGTTTGLERLQRRCSF